MKVLGWEINRADTIDAARRIQPMNFTAPDDSEGVVDIPAQGGMAAFALDFDGGLRTEADLITRYREMSLHPEVQNAIDDIVNESIITDDPNNAPITLDLELLEIPENIKQVIQQEFTNLLQLLKFQDRAYEVYRQWYIDGRLNYYLIIDPDQPQAGVQELRIVDPLKLRKVRESDNITAGPNVNIKQTVNEYYLYSDSGFNNNSGPSNFSNGGMQNSIKISKDAIVSVTSGLIDKSQNKVLSYLHSAIKPLNMLRMEEDAAVIYRLVRAPERYVFNVEVGGLPNAKASQFVSDQMTKYGNKVTYDSSTGNITDGRKFMTMMDNFWFPKRNGQGTTVDTLQSGTNLGEMADVEYFLRKLQEALKVPLSRLQPDSPFSMGRPSEITRDELKFMKFVSRLRMQFTKLFSELLEKQLVLKQIIAPEEWEQFEPYIKFIFTEDNFFQELKDSEIMRDRAGTMNAMMPFIDNYFSRRWAAKNIWRMTEDQWEEMQMEVMEDLKNAPPHTLPDAE